MGTRLAYVLQWLDGHLHRLHERHLLPLSLVRPICDWYEYRLLAASRDVEDEEFDAAMRRRIRLSEDHHELDGYFVEDEPVADVLDAFNRGEKGLTAMPEHVRRQWADDWNSPADSVYDKE